MGRRYKRREFLLDAAFMLSGSVLLKVCAKAEASKLEADPTVMGQGKTGPDAIISPLLTDAQTTGPNPEEWMHLAKLTAQ